MDSHWAELALIGLGAAAGGGLLGVRGGIGCRPALVTSRPLLITHNGKPVAVLLAVQERTEAEQIAARRSRSLRSIFAEAHEQIQKGGGIPGDQFWREVEESRRGRKRETSRGKMR